MKEGFLMRHFAILFLGLSFTLIPFTSIYSYSCGNKGNFIGGNSTKICASEVCKTQKCEKNAPYTKYYTYIKKHRPNYYRDSHGRVGALNWVKVAGVENSFFTRNRLGYFSAGYPVTTSMCNYHTFYRN